VVYFPKKRRSDMRRKKLKFTNKEEAVAEIKNTLQHPKVTLELLRELK
jgi:hypothetical protein